jgi:predicted TIM-barrel fold metal-dependent hydrolase
MREEFETMERLALQYGPKGSNILRGWKTYCPWGDVPNVSGWMFTDRVGEKFIAQVMKVSSTYGVPPVIATHKGFALPGFDQRAASPADIGPAASQSPKVTFIVYHSGYDIGDTQGQYPTENLVTMQGRGVDSLIKSLIASNWDASRFPDRNVPNVYAELGSVWSNVMADQRQAAHLLGKLITHVGPRRVIWGTDSLWYGSPQPYIARFREFPRNNESLAKDILAGYGLAHGLEGDVDNPGQAATGPRTLRNAILGRNAAVPYGIDPDATVGTIHCDKLQRTKEDYLIAPGTAQEAAPMRSNTMYGYRTRRELLANLWPNRPWAP